jgi:DNA mismatch repair protein MutL
MSLSRQDQVIHLLANDVINQIAAGEVIERPASIAKELVENALDAGAKLVRVSLEGGGLERLAVTDDGSGMSPIDARQSLLRHTTSKLKDACDLEAIRTLGFRGEALSSIAAVSRLTLTTRRPEDTVATRVVAEAGLVSEVRELGAPVGTTVDVRDLFFNTPARKSFMRSVSTEQSHVTLAALRVVLGSRQGGLVIAAGQRRIVDLSEESTEADRAREALGHRVDALYPFAIDHGGVTVSGFVARPDLDRADARGLWFFVNGRFVKDRMLQRALLDGYRTILQRGRFPLAMLYVDLGPASVDVNVHPQKLEVRFREPEVVFRAVSRAVTGVLAAAPWVSAGHGERVRAAVARFEAPTREILYAARARVETSMAHDAGPGPASLASWDAPALGAAGFFSRLRQLGPALGLFLVCEGQGELVLIDQHAAVARVAFERLRLQAAGRGIERQSLLFPAILAVPGRLLPVVEEHADLLLSFGVDVEAVGPERFAVRAIPTALTGADAERLLLDLLDELESVECPGHRVAAAEAQGRILSRLAGHAAIKAGGELNSEEIGTLFRALDAVDFAVACPHGRPVCHRLSRADLEKLFDR